MSATPSRSSVAAGAFDALPAGSLHPLPAQPADVPWPGDAWPRGVASEPVGALVEEMFAAGDRYGTTYAVVVVHEGRIVAERYDGALPRLDAPPVPVDASTPLLSWSVAKSVLHALVGVLVGDGHLALEVPAPVPEWSDPGDRRGAITLEHLLTMRDGLDFAEDYVEADRSHVIEMLFGEGRADVARFAARRPLRHRPDAVFNYSSGSSNIVSGIVAGVVGRGDAYGRFMRDALFDSIGMRSATPRFDETGTFVASSYLYATAQDFARFGLLYLRDGAWEGRRVLPDGWVDHGRRPRSRDPEDGRLYGAHWWVVGDEAGSFWANGYEGQSILVCPGRDLVVVRLGRSERACYPALHRWRAAMVDAVRVPG